MRKSKLLLSFVLAFLVVSLLNTQELVADDEPLTTATSAATRLPIFATNAGVGLPYLIEHMQGRKVFLLGDASHGTEEFYAFRKRITRHLIRDLGVRAVVLEAEADGGKLVDAYVRGLLPKTMDPRQMLIDAFDHWPAWVWANEELVEFVAWLKEFNSTLPPDQMVHCYGMDMQFSIGAALASLAGKWPEGSRLVKIYQDLLQWWQPYLADPILYRLAVAEKKVTGNLLASELLGALDTPDPETRRTLIMLIAVEEYYRTMATNQYEAWNIRARHFAGYVLNLLKENPGVNGVVAWAHNSHVGDMSGTDVQDTGLTNLGQLVREALGKEQVFIVGSAGYEGTVLAATEWYTAPMEMMVPPAANGSLEAILDGGGWDNVLLYFENEEQRQIWSTPLLHRGIGVTYNPLAEMPSYWLTAKIGVRYDALVFWRKTRSLQMLVAP